MKKLKKIVVIMQDNEEFTIPQAMINRLYLKRFETVIGIDGDGNLHRAVQAKELAIEVDEHLLNTIKTPSVWGGLGKRGLYDARELRLVFDTGVVIQLILPWKIPVEAPASNLDFYQYHPQAGTLKLFWSEDEYKIAELQDFYR